MDRWPIGVFASIDAGLGVHLEVARDLSISTIQLHAPGIKFRTARMAEQFKSRLDDMNLELTAVFGGFDGESYASIPIVEQSVGLVPTATRDARLIEMKAISDFARQLGCSVVALHLGFVPHDVNSKEYLEIVDATKTLCEYVGNNGQNLHLETGQESADGLMQFIEDTQAMNLFVNFDPANMILYGTDEPIAALRKLGSLVRSVHCKDALWSAKPGETWGREVPLGDGDVNIGEFLNTLAHIGYSGPLTIEREIPYEPERQKTEIGHAVRLLQELKLRMVGID